MFAHRREMVCAAVPDLQNVLAYWEQKLPKRKKRQASPLRVFPDSACPFMWFTKSKRAARRFCFVIFLVSIFLRFTQKIITHFHTNARPILILVSKLSLGFWGNMAVFSHFWGFFIDF